MSHTNTKREYSGEWQTRNVIAWLDVARQNKRAGKSYERICILKELLQQSLELSQSFMPAHRQPDLIESKSEFRKLIVVAGTKQTAINRLLRKYVVFPYITEIRLGAHRICNKWYPVSSKGFFNADVPSEFQRLTIRFSEPEAALALLNAANGGYLDQIVQCGQCSKWHFRKFSHVRFCTNSCAQKYYRLDPANKAKRRMYMRDLRKLHETKSFKDVTRKHGNQKAR